MNAPEIAPYRGLSSYGESDLDALLFFGRARDAEIVVANLVASRLTVLYGPSGVGKSSLLRAGVARTLRELPEQPLVVVFARWGDDPSRALADDVSAAAGLACEEGLVAAVRRAAAGRDVYLILDQAEEYFLYHPQTGAFEQELAELVAAPLRVDVLLSVREDALAKLDRFKALIPNILGNYLRLDRLDRRAGERAILGPLERLPSLGGRHVTIEPSLVERVLDEVAVGRITAGGAEPERPAGNGSARIEAPFLQLVMQRLWEIELDAGEDELRVATLDRLGGSSRIVADHLERALAALQPAQRDIASRLFNHLVTPSGAKIAQQSADLAEYAGVPEADVAPVLGSLSDHRIVRRDDGGRFEIFHDVLAGAVLAWRVRHERERAVERAREDARRRHRRRGLLAFGALFACVLVGAAAVWAGIERGTARAEARRATARALEAHAATTLADDPELSLLLAAEAGRLVPSTAAEAALRRALLASRLRAVVRSSGPLVAAEPVAGRGVLVTGGETGRAIVARMRDGTVVGSFDQQAPITALAASPTGDVALTGGRDGSAVLWAVPDGRPVHELVGARKAITKVAFAPRGGLVLVASADGAVRTYDSASGELVATLSHARRVRDAAFSADGRLIATTVGDARIRIWNARTAERVETLDQGGFALSVAFDRTGAFLASTGANRTLRVWNARTWDRVFEAVGSSGRVVPVAFGPGGRLVASGRTDGVGTIRDARDGSLVGGIKHDNAITDVEFDPTGVRIATASTDRTARVWAAKDGTLLGLLQGHDDTVATVRFSGDGRSLVTASADGTARVWDVDIRPQLRVAASDGPAPPTLVATSPDGRTTARAAGRTIVLTGPSGRHVLRQHHDDVDSIAFSADGTRLVTGSRDHDSIVFDAATGAFLYLLRIHGGTVTDAQFSPDSRWIVTAGPRTVGLWSAATGRLVELLKGPESTLTAAAFTPDSRGIVTREKNGDVRQADCSICGGVDELLPLARERLGATGRVLTDEERRLYVG